MSAIFISYTGRDPEGRAMAEQVADWLREWGYRSFFRDKELKEGVPAGRDWRQLLHARLAQCQLLIAVCSPCYEGSAWCMAEIAIAMDRGHKLVPLQLGKTALPLLLQNKQAITIQEPIVLAAAMAGEAAEDERRRLETVRQCLQQALNELLDWRARMPRLADQTSPYPGLFSFDETHATVFFGRDEMIDALERKVLGFRGHRSEFLLLQGPSGSGKSSLLRAGLIPRLRVAMGQGFLVVDPFRLDRQPLETVASLLRQAMVRDGVTPQFTAGGAANQLLDDCARWRLHTQRQDAMVVLPIDQFEDLFSGSDVVSGQKEVERFLEFLADLLAEAGGRVLVLATIRTDFLAVLESRVAILEQRGKRLRWAAEPIPPMAPALYSEVIEGPARQVGLRLEDGLTSSLVADTGSGDALPLLAFTLMELWGHHAKRQFQPVEVDRVGLVHLLRRDLATIGGVSGSVSRKAEEVERTCSAAELEALREAFLGHLVRINEEGEGGAAKQKAPLAQLPPASQALVKQMVEERLLVSDAGEVEIAHEALLRTWPKLVDWIEEGKEELLQRRRVRRLGDDLKAEAPRQRRQALEQLAALAAAGGSEERAVEKEAAVPLAALLTKADRPLAEREDAALVLALIGEVDPLQKCLADPTAPVALRRRAAESLGLVAKRSGDPNQRQQIADELEKWLRSEALDVLIEVEFDPAKLEPATVQELVEESQRQVAEAMLQALQSGQLPSGLGETELQQIFQNALEDQLKRHLQQLERQVWVAGQAPGWAEHDALLPLLQGASRGLQLALSAELPMLGSGEEKRLPMLTLTALEEGNGLRVRSVVVVLPVWKLPLPGAEQLELVLVPAAENQIGSADAEDGRTVYSQFRNKCDPGEVEVEARRTVQLQAFALVRHPISQAQWRALVESMAEDKRGSLKPGPGTFRAEDLWERHGQPGGLPVDSVSWNDSKEWLQALNGWLAVQWPSWVEDNPAMAAVPARLDLPSESQWEAACRADTDNPTPFHFGATLDASWARYDASYTYGKGRRGEYGQRPVPIGFFGVVNRLGLAELHGQLNEWCGDQWHRDPVAAAPADGAAMEGLDPGLAGDKEQRHRLVRGGSWFNNPLFARAAFRDCGNPGFGTTNFGLRPCCPSPLGSLLGA